MALRRLFSPIRVGGMELKNRIVMAPMHTDYSNEDGSPSTLDIHYFNARARGGAGLIILPSVSIDPKAPFPRSPVLCHDRYIPEFQKMNRTLHAYGAKVMPEICHPGPFPRPVSVLSLEDIHLIIEQYGDAAVRARKADFDGLEIHAAHAFMVLGSFISALCNKRTDAYGGSIESRVRLLIEVIQKIKEQAGKDFPVIVRISGDELVPGGRTIRETQYIAPMLTDAGLDAFDISIGVFGHPLMAGTGGTGTPAGVTVPLAKAVKEVVDVPVGAVGRINDPRFAEDVLSRNEADLILMGRPLLADPDLPNKAAEGRFEDIAPCIGCGLGCSVFGKRVTCLVNPTLGTEEEAVITPASRPKKVLVAGGGPGGLEAAMVAALRGHKVTLCEKSTVLGGQFNLAAVAPMKQELTTVIKYLATQIEKAGVEVRLNTEVNTVMVEKAKPNVVIIATGGEPFVPDLPGAEGKNIYQAHDILAGKVMIDPGNVLVVGGGMVGCEVAEWLANTGEARPGTLVSVTIVEMMDDIALDMANYNRAILLQQLREKGVKVVTRAQVKEFLDDGVAIIKDGQDTEIRGMDSIVLAMGARTVDKLSGEIKGVPEVYIIGDAKEARKALEAIAEGSEVARKI